jgi:hypothetical protein
MTLKKLVAFLAGIAGMVVFVSAFYYWIRLTFKSNGEVLRAEAAASSFSEVAWFISKDLFLLVLAYMGIRIAWTGFAALFLVVQKEAAISILARMLKQPGMSNRKRAMVIRQLLAHLTAPVLEIDNPRLDGVGQVIAILKAARGVVEPHKALQPTRLASRRSKKQGTSRRPDD